MSGTQIGTTRLQQRSFRALIRALTFRQFHHGDCVGADEECHNIVRRVYPRCDVQIHPPTNNSKRAYCEGGTVLPERDYLNRNRYIVKAVDAMVILPSSVYEQIRSGTWTSYRYAVKAENCLWVYVIFPDGTIDLRKEDRHLTMF